MPLSTLNLPSSMQNTPNLSAVLRAAASAAPFEDALMMCQAADELERLNQRLCEVGLAGGRMSKETVLEEAQRLVDGPRQADYGHPKENFEVVARLWEPIIGVKLSPMGVALCMIQLKVSRQLHKPKRDNLTDICGYARTAEKLDEP